jgi:hypothetical protein
VTFSEQVDFSSRLNFLYKAVDDTQLTIRFIDTKAAFCVTLLTCMVAGSLQADQNSHSLIHRFSFFLFLVSVGLTLLICLRVIFPVIKPQSASSIDSSRVLPKYFIHQQRDHHWIRHALSSSVGDVLDDDHASYTATLSAATDADLFSSMCDELLMVSLVRQIKSDRLQSVIFPLIAAIVCFLAMMVS